MKNFRVRNKRRNKNIESSNNIKGPLDETNSPALLTKIKFIMKNGISDQPYCNYNTFFV